MDHDPKSNSPLPNQAARNVQVVADMHRDAERAVRTHQRAVELGTALLGRAASVYVILAAVVLWIVGNLVALRVGGWAPDPPPFAGLQGVIGLAALITATMILTTQSRQAKLIERRMHLDLQVNLLAEQKAAKLIELLEELRRDLPNVRNRRDSEAEMMQHAAEPAKVIAALEEQTAEALREAMSPEREGNGGVPSEPTPGDT